MNFLTDGEIGLSQGALYALLSILMVFVILLIIIGITTLVFKTMGLFEMKAELDAVKKGGATTSETKVEEPKSVAIADDDMMAAVLVASIDYRKEIGKDVRVVNVKEIK